MPAPKSITVPENNKELTVSLSSPSLLGYYTLFVSGINAGMAIHTYKQQYGLLIIALYVMGACLFAFATYALYKNRVTLRIRNAILTVKHSATIKTLTIGVPDINEIYIRNQRSLLGQPKPDRWQLRLINKQHQDILLANGISNKDEADSIKRQLNETLGLSSTNRTHPEPQSGEPKQAEHQAG